MFESDKRSAIERLKKSLYSRGSDFSEPMRHDIHGGNDEVPKTWAHDEAPAAPPEPLHPKVRSWYKKILLGSLALFFVALGLVFYSFFGGRTFVSVDNIDLLIEGPVSVAGGETLPLSVSVVNKNSTDMELADLIIEFPEGAKDPSNPSKDLVRSRISVGQVKSGSLAQKSVSAILFGEEGAERRIKFTIEYRTPGSNAIFFKEKYYTVSISSSPVLLTLDALDKVTAGEESLIKVTITSNTTSVVKDLLLATEYPFGWSFSSADPKPLFGETVWRIGDLAPGAKKVIIIRGIAAGQDGEERTLHANVGIQSASDENKIATTIIAEEHTFLLEKPFLGLSLAINGDRSGTLAVEPGRIVRGEVLWTNNSMTKISRAQIEVRLSGVAFDKNSVSVDDGGNYDSRTNTITWAAGRTEGLLEIAPGASDRVGFSFYPTRPSPSQSANSSISISASARGERQDETSGSGTISSAASATVKLVSNLSLSSRALRSQGPFSNTGPIPPRVDQETTYTVTWTLTNTSNSISDAEVRAVLPAYVKWLSKVSPAQASVTYNPVGGEVVWLAGDVPKNADVGAGAKEVSFQVVLVPNASQRGTAPILVGDAVVTGIDDFTGVTLRNTAPGLTTRTTSDIFWKQGDELVQD